MAFPVCSICRNPQRAEIDADLLNMPANAVARKRGLHQGTLSRHLRNHLKPHVHAIAHAAGPMPKPSPQAQAIALIPTVGAVLADLGATVERLKVLADDAEKDGGLGMRAVALRELRSGLTDTAKLLAVLRPTDAPPVEVIDRTALADLLVSTDTDSRQAILNKLAL